MTERVGKYGLLIFLIVAFAGFSLARPAEFASWANVKTTLDQQTPIIIGGLAVMIPLLTGESTCPSPRTSRSRTSSSRV